MSAVTGVPSDKPVAVQEAFAVVAIFAGAVIVGLIASTTVAITEENTTLFPLSDPNTSTVFCPTLLQLNELGIVNNVTVQLSVEPLSIIAGVKFATPFAFKFKVTSCRFNTGLIKSCTITVAGAVEAFPWISVTVS